MIIGIQRQTENGPRAFLRGKSDASRVQVLIHTARGEGGGGGRRVKADRSTRNARDKGRFSTA